MIRTDASVKKFLKGVYLWKIYLFSYNFGIDDGAKSKFGTHRHRP